MSAVTRVPILPVGKGTLTKLWLGIAIAVLLAGGIAWAGLSVLPKSAATFLADNADETGVTALPSGVQYKTLVPGTGASPTARDYVLVNYSGSLIDGEIFDAGQQTPMALNRVVPGFAEGLQKMQKGGKYRLWIPPALGYGAEEKTDPQTGTVGIPANSLLVFDIELLEFITPEQLQAMQQQVGPGGPGGPPAGPPQSLMPAPGM